MRTGGRCRPRVARPGAFFVWPPPADDRRINGFGYRFVVTCPKCGAPRHAADLECPRCGVVFAKLAQRFHAVEAEPFVAASPPVEISPRASTAAMVARGASDRPDDHGRRDCLGVPVDVSRVEARGIVGPLQAARRQSPRAPLQDLSAANPAAIVNRSVAFITADQSHTIIWRDSPS